MKTKMVTEMTTEERKSLQNEMEAFAPKLKRLEKVANAQSHTMAWTPACGNYLPEGLRILCHFKDSKPYAEDAISNGKTSEAAKEFIVFWQLAKEQLDEIISGKEINEEHLDEDNTEVSDSVSESENDENEVSDQNEVIIEDSESISTDEENNTETKKDSAQTRRGRK